MGGRKVLRVANWMTADPLVVRLEVSVGEAFASMQELGIHHLIVVAEGRLVGMVSDRDRMFATDEQEVGEVMTRELHTIGENAPLEVAAALMRMERVHALPVIDERGDPVGIITANDVLQAFEKTVSQVRKLRRKVTKLEKRASKKAAGSKSKNRKKKAPEA